MCAAVKADSAATTLEDIKGSDVAVKNGTQSAAWAESIKDEYQLKLTYYDYSLANIMYQAVKSGNAVANASKIIR